MGITREDLAEGEKAASTEAMKEAGWGQCHLKDKSYGFSSPPVKFKIAFETSALKVLKNEF